MDSELSNVRAALAWTDAANEREWQLRLATAISYYCWVRGLIREGLRTVEDVLAHGQDVAVFLRLRGLTASGHLARLWATTPWPPDAWAKHGSLLTITAIPA
jgi:hypothetical protein